MKKITHSKKFQTICITILMGSLLFSACTQASSDTNPQTNPVIPTYEVPTQKPPSPTPVTATEMPDTSITFGFLSVSIPPQVANGASGSEILPIDSADAAWWQKTPGHMELNLGDYYVLKDKFLQPKIFVYPAQAYAELVPTAFESMHRLNNILGNPSGTTNLDQLPVVPFFNSQPVFASNIAVASFQNGKGVRFLTEYGQNNLPVNNYDLLYQFQGLTSDGAYYIVAIFPITVPVLADTNDATASVPPGGITVPDTTDPKSIWQDYYTAVSELLNSAPQDNFSPPINQLDLLINSILITP